MTLVHVVIAKSVEELRQARSIRYHAYVDAGHVEPSTDPYLGDHRDASATCFVAYVDGHAEAVGTVRALVHDTSLFEAGDIVEQVMRPRERVCELTKLAVLPAFQKRKDEANVFVHLSRAVSRWLIERADIDAAYVVTIEKNAQLYERLGFRRVRGPFDYPPYPRPHFALRLGTEEALPLRWRKRSGE
ncbi:GNAT family N-acetyltransferase [Nannocystis sp. ILAH1]|uniref:GNAT family N-acetyltransferase n=1 Tax=Nannocystis sp. ILAH1 TaxID=2996789 RepID=UPI00226FD360|nr:GNAT family N-acetyltransferase [Nannocystis sp. ILAH1]MCY0994767.1 GNAT family N-acetyltransferase [Nannocystis sp. ILAH1]